MPPSSQPPASPSPLAAAEATASIVEGGPLEPAREPASSLSPRFAFGDPRAGELATAWRSSASSPPERSISLRTSEGSLSPPERGSLFGARSPPAPGTLSTYWSTAGSLLGAAMPAGGRIVSSTSAITGAATRAADSDRRSRRPFGSFLRFALVPLIASLVVVDALLGGGAPPEVRSVAAILVWWGVLAAVAFGLAPRAPVPRAALACAALLAAVAVFMALSSTWAPSAERAFFEADRVLLYTGLVLIPVLLALPGDAGRWADGMALAVAVVGLLALAQRLFGGLLPEGDVPELLPNAASRLSYPLGYWNGLAIFVALGCPLLLRAAVTAASPLWRAAALAPVPVLAGTIYLTSSRGGVAVALVACAAFVVLSGSVRAVVAGAVAGAGSLGAVAILSARQVLVDGPFGSGAAEDAGTEAALLIGAVCLLAAVLYAVLAALVPARLRVPRVAWALVAVALVVGVVAADPGERIDTFRAEPAVSEAPGATQVDAHLSTGGGSGRWQFWSAAADQWREHPLAGAGAGAFEPYWAEHGTLDWFVRNAHSLWLETLAELGVIGLLLIVGAFAVGIAAGVARLGGRRDDERATVAALLAVVLGFALSAAIEWTWQLPVIAALALLSLGLLTGPATARGEPSAAAPSVSFGVRAAVIMGAWIVLCAQAIPFLATREVGASQRAAARGEPGEALERAQSAEAIQPWAASPRLQQALVREELGQLRAARRALAAAIERDGSDWRLRLVATRLAVKDGDVATARRELARARSLNPRSPLLRDPNGVGVRP